ncbi:MAG: hypothetical protein AB1758_21770, partial [Candidatus Eremiobacterota bacterium]
EVKVNPEEGDYNLEILEDVAEESLGDGWRVDEENARYYDAQGREITDPEQQPGAARVVYRASNGDESQELAVDMQQVEVPLEGSEETRAVTVYSSSPGGRPGHTVVYGPSLEGSYQYGNAVVLAPGNELPRDSLGRVDPHAIHMALLGRDPDDDEPRTALGVTFTAGGEEVHAVSAHLTNRKQGHEDRDQSIREQYARHEFFTRQWYGDNNTITGGDFNSVPGEDGFPEVDLEGVSVDGKDVVLVNRQDRIENAETRGRGGSDHALIVTDVVV